MHIGTHSRTCINMSAVSHLWTARKVDLLGQGGIY